MFLSPVVFFSILYSGRFPLKPHMPSQVPHFLYIGISDVGIMPPVDPPSSFPIPHLRR